MKVGFQAAVSLEGTEPFVIRFFEAFDNELMTFHLLVFVVKTPLANGIYLFKYVLR